MSNYVFMDDPAKVEEACAEAMRGGITMIRCVDEHSAKCAAQNMADATDEKWFSYESNYACNRYVATRAPRVGEEVSRAFNGDYYPCGKIVKVSPSLAKIETDEGFVFYRSKNRPSAWLNNGMWSMVPGRIDKRNPHF